MGEIVHNLEVIRNKIADASKGKEVTLVAVSKTKPYDAILEAFEAGQRIFGENKMQELKDKQEALCNHEIDWHFIGKLQSNKVKYLDDGIKLVQSIDSKELLENIQNHKATATEVLLQINIGNEPQKNGFSYENFEKSVELLGKFDTIKIMGLMCIPPVEKAPDEYFLKMHDMFLRLQEKNIKGVEMKYLSMGMSGDFEQAIKCGSNMVRVGSSIFGKRL